MAKRRRNFRHGNSGMECSTRTWVYHRSSRCKDPRAQRYRLQSGAAPARSLFFPSGHCMTVGLGGFLLQGGFGWNSRLWGPACASVTAVDVVTADGALVHADETQNSDLLWAARGAGPGFFGVITRFHLRTQPVARAMTHDTWTFELDDL